MPYYGIRWNGFEQHFHRNILEMCEIKRPAKLSNKLGVLYRGQ